MIIPFLFSSDYSFSKGTDETEKEYDYFLLKTTYNDHFFISSFKKKALIFLLILPSSDGRLILSSGLHMYLHTWVYLYILPHTHI